MHDKTEFTSRITVMIHMEVLLGVITCQQGAHNQAHGLLVTVIASDSANHHQLKIGSSLYIMAILIQNLTILLVWRKQGWCNFLPSHCYSRTLINPFKKQTYLKKVEKIIDFIEPFKETLSNRGSSINFCSRCLPVNLWSKKWALHLS